MIAAKKREAAEKARKKADQTLAERIQGVKQRIVDQNKAAEEKAREDVERDAENARKDEQKRKDADEARQQQLKHQRSMVTKVAAEKARKDAAEKVRRVEKRRKFLKKFLKDQERASVPYQKRQYKGGFVVDEQELQDDGTYLGPVPPPQRKAVTDAMVNEKEAMARRASRKSLEQKTKTKLCNEWGDDCVDRFGKNPVDRVTGNAYYRQMKSFMKEHNLDTLNEFKTHLIDNYDYVLKWFCEHTTEAHFVSQ